MNRAVVLQVQASPHEVHRTNYAAGLVTLTMTSPHHRPKITEITL